MKQDNRIVVDLRKVQWARFCYVNQYGQIVNVLPAEMTYRLRTFTKTGYMLQTGREIIANKPKVSEHDWIVSKGYQDKWTATLTLKLTANESLVYTGTKAKSIWKEWNRRQFTKSKS